MTVNCIQADIMKLSKYVQKQLLYPLLSTWLLNKENNKTQQLTMRKKEKYMFTYNQFFSATPTYYLCHYNIDVDWMSM